MIIMIVIVSGKLICANIFIKNIGIINSFGELRGRFAKQDFTCNFSNEETEKESD